MRGIALRLIRVGGVSVLFALVVRVSRLATAARAQGAPLPPIAGPLAGISVVLLLAALVTEKTRGPEGNLQKDVLWGISLGGLGAACSILF